MPLFPLLERKSQMDLYEFKSSLVYRANFRTAMAVTQRNLVSKKKEKKKRRKKGTKEKK